MQRDNEYYLTHNFYGEEDNHGQVFLDERNSPDLSDDNTILYGHNITSDRSMFNVLTNFRDPEFVAENPVIQVNTLYQKYEYAVAAVYLAATRPEHGEIFDYINYLKFSTQDAKEAYIAQIEKRSMLDTGVELTADDKLLTFFHLQLRVCRRAAGGGGAPPAGRRDGGGLRQGGRPDRGPADAGDLDRAVWITIFAGRATASPSGPAGAGLFLRGGSTSGAPLCTPPWRGFQPRTPGDFLMRRKSPKTHQGPPGPWTPAQGVDPLGFPRFVP